MENQAEIYISYAWGGASEVIVDQLYNSFIEKKYRVIRDKVDLGFKGSITAFMDQIGAGKAVVVVISDKYLRSENCMYELVQIQKNGQFAERIFPIVLADADIYKPAVRLQYVSHWENEIVKLNAAMKSVTDMSVLSDIQRELSNYRDILNAISNIMFVLKDMNTLTPDMHRGEDFKSMLRALDARLMSDDKRVEIPVNALNVKKIIIPSVAVVLIVISFLLIKTHQQPSSPIKTADTIKHETTSITSITPSTKKQVGSTVSSNSAISKKTEDFQIKVRTSKGTELKEGDDVMVYFTLSGAGYVRLIYKMADGTAVLLADNLKVTDDQAGKEQKVLTTFQCAAPFGAEVLGAYAQSEVFDELKIKSQDGYWIIDQPLSEAYQLTEKGLKRKVQFSMKKLDIKTRAK